MYDVSQYGCQQLKKLGIVGIFEKRQADNRS